MHNDCIREGFHISHDTEGGAQLLYDVLSKLIHSLCFHNSYLRRLVNSIKFG